VEWFYNCADGVHVVTAGVMCAELGVMRLSWILTCAQWKG
jgi:hypothetical protein